MTLAADGAMRLFAPSCTSRAASFGAQTTVVLAVMIALTDAFSELPSYRLEVFHEASNTTGLVNAIKLRRPALAPNGTAAANTAGQLEGASCEMNWCQVYDYLRELSNQSDSQVHGAEAGCASLVRQLALNCSERALNASNVTAGSSSHNDEPLSQTEVWGFGFLFMALISSTSLAGAILLPFRKKPAFDLVLMFLVALAMGCLIGNGLFVLVPEAFEIVEHDLYLWKSSVILAGVYAFYVMEEVMGMLSRRRCCGSSGSRRQSLENRATQAPVAAHASEAPHLFHSHQHHHQHQFLDSGFNQPDQKSISKKDSSAILVRCMSNGSEAEKCDQQHVVAVDSSNNLQIADNSTPTTAKPVATLAYMVLVGHGIHNFIDGMSIGAAFASDKVLGISLSLAVFIEEIPHGLGDFAILLNSGMRKKRAVLYNFLASCPCFLGLVAGIKLSEVMNAAPWILGIAGGIFIYISLADMLPEMKEAQENSDSPLMTFFIQNVGIICGVFIIVVMAVYGEGIQI